MKIGTYFQFEPTLRRSVNPFWRPVEVKVAHLRMAGVGVELVPDNESPEVEGILIYDKEAADDLFGSLKRCERWEEQARRR